MSLHKEIPDEILNELKKVIEENNMCHIQIQKSFSGYWLADDNGIEDNELRIFTLGKFRLTISRVNFKYKRKGTMTKVLKILCDFCRKENIDEIVVQSVLTYEMMQFCLKNNFIPSKENILVDNVLTGDYILKMKIGTI